MAPGFEAAIAPPFGGFEARRGGERDGKGGGWRRRLFLALGGACVGMGTIGIFVPGLPTTVFLLAASWLFARSSPRLHRRLTESSRLGPYLRMAREGSMPRRRGRGGRSSRPGTAP
jgi:hypothetical protein